MEELLKNISLSDLEKLKVLLSIIPANEPKEVVTLRVFAEEYSDLIKHNRSKAYYDSVVYSLKYLTDFFGSQKSIHSICLRDIETFTTHLQQKASKPASSSRGEGYRVYHRTLKAALNKAIEWGYVKENYFLKVKLPKKQKVAPLFINSDQLSAICDRIKSEVIKKFVVIAFYTGMRLDEIVNLKWENVDLLNRVITVGDEEFITKGRNQRHIPICDEANEAFVRLRQLGVKETPSRLTDGQACILPLKKRGEVFKYVFCKNSDEKFTGDYISQTFKRACKTAGMDKRIHFHTLRHSFASNLVQKGVSLYSVKELLGHASISTTEIYSHLNMDSLREAVKMLDGKSEKRDEEPSLAILHHSIEKRENSQPLIFRINSGEL